jgi:hypothetical protein
MGSTIVSVGRRYTDAGTADKEAVYIAACRLAEWLEKNRYEGYDTFDGLNSPLLRPLTFNNGLLRTVLQQGIRRFPINLRPLVGIAKSHSTKGMGFIARGFLRLHAATSERTWREKAESALKWLVDHQSPGYSGACWGNHFDYQSRKGFVPRNVPSIVWTSLIGHAFLDAYQQIGGNDFLHTAVSACEHIRRDLGALAEGEGLCLNYFPISSHQVHNANVLGAGLLARTYSFTGNGLYKELSKKAIHYTASHQRADSSWFYGEASNLRWVDNFHTAYVLDSFKHYRIATGDDRYQTQVARGYQYWKATFFLEDGTPRYYSHKIMPLDIQCCSQAIDTLVFFRDEDPESLDLAARVAKWTIANMQDRTGYFYYRKYWAGVVNKTPTLHWGQATMICALAGLYQAMQQR